MQWSWWFLEMGIHPNHLVLIVFSNQPTIFGVPYSEKHSYHEMWPTIPREKTQPQFCTAPHNWTQVPNSSWFTRDILSGFFIVDWLINKLIGWWLYPQAVPPRPLKLWYVLRRKAIYLRSPPIYCKVFEQRWSTVNGLRINQQWHTPIVVYLWFVIPNYLSSIIMPHCFRLPSNWVCIHHSPLPAFG